MRGGQLCLNMDIHTILVLLGRTIDVVLTLHPANMTLLPLGSHNQVSHVGASEVFIVFAGKLVLVGGNDGTHSLCSTEIWDPQESSWVPGPTMTTCRTNVAVAMVGNRLWAVGGFSGN